VEIELPVTVDLEVTKTEPGVRGDTATGATKRATLETGLAVIRREDKKRKKCEGIYEALSRLPSAILSVLWHCRERE
ncbi:MAG: hypothetical protein HGA78_07195, partial [Nitrospirales bacterium]|nr:hypothetical protein [Nitrospirales bacterium]